AARNGDGQVDGASARVEVSVERGIVEVRNRRDGTEVHRLTAGQRFSTPIAAAPSRQANDGAARGTVDGAGPDGAPDVDARAARLAPAGPLQEDALARLAQANARLGRGADCRRARDAYRSRYPDGIHAVMVAGACDRSGSAQP